MIFQIFPVLQDIFWLRDKGTCVFGKNSSEGFVQHAKLLFGKNHKQLLLVTAWHFLELHTRHWNGFHGLSSLPKIPRYCNSFQVSHNFQTR